MKTILEFNLPKEKREAELAMAAVDLYITLEQVNNILRASIKHSDDSRDAAIECRSIITDVIGRFE